MSQSPEDPASHPSSCEEDCDSATEVRGDGGYQSKSSFRRTKRSHLTQTLAILSSRMRDASDTLSTAQDGIASFDRQLNHLHGILELARGQMDKSLQGHKELSKHVSLSQRTSESRAYDLRRRSTREVSVSLTPPVSDSVDSQ